MEPPDIAAIYDRFRLLMPDLPENYRDGLFSWTLVTTTAEAGVSGVENDRRVDLIFVNGLEYHGSIHGPFSG